MTADPFDSLLTLEDQFYQEGYKAGTEDGTEAGKIEGRSFGLEKGFEKFLDSGKLYGKALVWANRLPTSPEAGSDSRKEGSSPVTVEESSSASEPQAEKLPPLPGNARLEKNIITLHALVEPDTLSTENTDEAVNDFDDRVKRAHGKVRIIEKMLGQDAGSDTASTSAASSGKKDSDDAGGSSSQRSPPTQKSIAF